MIDLRFPTALQIMLLLTVADRSGTPAVSSALLAQGVGIHASFVRRLLAPLIDAGLLLSAKGKNGGARLARPADRITLAEIYQAAAPEKRLWEARHDGPRSCLVSIHTAPFFESLASDAEQAVLQLLAGRTLAGSLAELERLERASAGKPPPALDAAPPPGT